MENISNFADDNQSSNIKPFMDFKETFKRYGYNTSQMAERMGMAQQNLSRQIIQGTINIRQLEQMAEICGVSLGEFVGADMPQEFKLNINGKTYICKEEK